MRPHFFSMSKKPVVKACYEMESRNVRIQVHRLSNAENTSEEITFLFSSAVNFLESFAKELDRFSDAVFFFLLQVKKTLHGCFVEFNKISRSTGERECFKSYTIDDFESLAAMQHDLVTVKIDMAKVYFEELTRPSIEEQFQTDTLEM